MTFILVDELIVSSIKVVSLICLGDFNWRFKEHM